MQQNPQPRHPPKNLAIRRCVLSAMVNGNYRFSAHALNRMRERSIDQIDVKDVLTKGQREKQKDQFDQQHNRWSYAFRGVIEDGRRIRIVAAEVNPAILIITAIDLDHEN